VGRKLAASLIALAGLACREQGSAPRDASSDGSKSDVPSPLTLDIAVTGCASYDPTTPICTGRPPLTLSFAPVGSPELTRFLWTFGDGTPTTTERAPSHTYAHEGRYTVKLIGGANDIGNIKPPNELTIAVAPLGAGAPCDVDIQCAGGLACVCAPGSGCPPAFVRGVCSMACDTAACDAHAVCAALAIGPASAAGTGGPAPLCLASCTTNTDCAPGFVCQILPAGSPAAGTSWTRGCVPLGALVDAGGPCRDANEALADDACATGLCADAGALGICSATCDDRNLCPDQTACARLADGRQLCLRTCASDPDCGRDPLLACAPLQRVGDGPDLSACGPKSCTGDASCAPSGRCGPDGVCVRK
jgi:PKD domain-containing protein